MGMFDDLTCGYPLPNPEHQDLDYQTKDLDCTLSRYKISVEGQLFWLHGHWEGMPSFEETATMSYLEHSRALDKAKWIEEPPTLVEDVHGDIYIYSGEAEYMVRFTHGKVEWIKPVEQ